MPSVQDDVARTIKCPHCDHTYFAKTETWEKIKKVEGKLKCSKCKKVFVVPLQSEASFNMDLDLVTEEDTQFQKKSSSLLGSLHEDERTQPGIVSSNSDLYSVEEPTKNCPFCQEVIRENAKKCRHCGEHLNAPMMPNPVLYNPYTRFSEYLGNRNLFLKVRQDGYRIFCFELVWSCTFRRNIWACSLVRLTVVMVL